MVLHSTINNLKELVTGCVSCLFEIRYSHSDESSSFFISLLPISSKVVEKLIKKKILNYLQTFNRKTDKQFGFQDSRGTHDAIHIHLERVYFGMNHRKPSAAVFCDSSKAFVWITGYCYPNMEGMVFEVLPIRH